MFPIIKPISLGSVTLSSPVFLAPMAGVTDVPFRRLVKKYGAGLVVSEMIASQALIRESKKTLQMIQSSAGEAPEAVQLAGSDPEIMAACAKMNEDRGVALLDINFGCPAKKIVNGHAGSYLMKDEVHAGKLIEAVVKAVSIPVTVKMRLGWSSDTINAPRLAKIAEESGVRLVTVHGRTRNQFYEGHADWEKVGEVKRAIHIPVIVNGDIHTRDDAVLALAQSGADGIMVGRATYGKPWLLKQLMSFLADGTVLPDPSIEQLYAILMEHWESMLSYYGTETGMRIARKHIGWYSKGLPQSAEFRSAVNNCADASKVRSYISDFFHPLLERAVS